VDVAAQIETYIRFNPKVKKEDLNKDLWFKSVAVQRVGETGYTAVHDTRGINYFHSNPRSWGWIFMTSPPGFRPSGRFWKPV